MAIPRLEKQNIIEALNFIDKNGVPNYNVGNKYVLVSESGKKYPLKYVLAVADHLANGVDISIKSFNSDEVKKYLESQGFTVENKQQEKFELTISADDITSTDKRFSMYDLSFGDYYCPLDAYFQKANGDIIKRAYLKGEKRISNQTLPRIACQVFEKQLISLSVEDKENFPVCRYFKDSDTIRGIFASVDEFKNNKINSLEYLKYTYDNGRQFVFYSWNIFSTLIFVQECLKRFGEKGDKFTLIYREKDEKEPVVTEKDEVREEEPVEQVKGYRNPFSSMLLESKNLILRGAPGTGKTYLAKEIAADIISNGYFDDYTFLTEEQKQQVEFVQFHPGYDYSDFVEGLRPKLNNDGSMGFELKDGIFKKFIDRARKNYEDSQKTKDTVEKEVSVQRVLEEFFSGIEFGVDTFKTINGNEFTITDVDDEHIYISIPGNATVNHLALNLAEVRKMLESGQQFEKVKDITTFFKKTFATQGYSYDFAIYHAIKSQKIKASNVAVKQEELKKYIFIIDEINRGEISKIFGELFFAIDPGYRGEEGAISTQYASLHADPNEKFYIPDNVYIIGTMNDIDRSVDSFDFAMRRRFRFVEIKADDRLEMLANLKNEKLRSEAIRRMSALNKEIAAVEDLNENYQIGAAYFLKLQTLNFDKLWTDYLKPLLQEYIQGMYDEKAIMDRFAKAYGYQDPKLGDVDEATQDQG